MVKKLYHINLRTNSFLKKTHNLKDIKFKNFRNSKYFILKK
jgi:hypothetical protein